MVASLLSRKSQCAFGEQGFNNIGGGLFYSVRLVTHWTFEVDLVGLLCTECRLALYRHFLSVDENLPATIKEL